MVFKSWIERNCTIEVSGERRASNRNYLRRKVFCTLREIDSQSSRLKIDGYIQLIVRWVTYLENTEFIPLPYHCKFELEVVWELVIIHSGSLLTLAELSLVVYLQNCTEVFGESWCSIHSVYIRLWYQWCECVYLEFTGGTLEVIRISKYEAVDCLSEESYCGR